MLSMLEYLDHSLTWHNRAHEYFPWLDIQIKTNASLHPTTPCNQCLIKLSRRCLKNQSVKGGLSMTACPHSDRVASSSTLASSYQLH